MIIYTHPKHSHVQEVDPRETVRMRLLERAGWSAREDAPAVAEVGHITSETLGDLSGEGGYGSSGYFVGMLAVDAPAPTVHDIFDAKLADLLSEAGFSLASQVNEAPDSILLKISGIGPAKLAQIREAFNG